MSRISSLASAIQRIACIVIFAACAGFAAPVAANMQVAPLIIELDKSPGASSVFRVTNANVSEIPVEVRVVRRVIAPDGSTIDEPADDDFVVFPPQVVIGGRETQVFRFQYVGADDLETSSSYYLYASQLPVDLDDDDGDGIRVRLSFLYEYGVAVHLIPSSAEPELIATSAKAVRTEGGGHGVELSIINNGARFGRAAEHRLVLRGSNGQAVFEPDVLRRGLNNGMWLPGQTFTITFPVEQALTGEIEAQFFYLGG